MIVSSWLHELLQRHTKGDEILFQRLGHYQLWQTVIESNMVKKMDLDSIVCTNVVVDNVAKKENDVHGFNNLKNSEHYFQWTEKLNHTNQTNTSSNGGIKL